MEAFDIKNINIYLNDSKLLNEKIKIKKMQIRKQVNEHNSLYTDFLFRKEDKDKYKAFNKSEKLEIRVTVSEKGGIEKILFEGYAVNSSMTLDKHILMMQIRGISFSKRYDIKKNNRVYQDNEIMYSKIVNDLKNGDVENKDLNILINGEDSQTGRFLIQYRETDWNFMKRIAYYINTFILCEKKSVIFNKSSLKEFEEVSDYTIHSFGRNSRNEIEYKINSYSIYSTGDIVKLSDNDEEGKMLVVRADILLEKQRLKGNYILIRADKYKAEYTGGNNIQGSALEGEVQEILMSDSKGMETASVKVKFYKNLESRYDSGNITAPEQGESLYPFPYIIPYSKDKTGLFITPEIGDNVLVKFSDENPENGIVEGALNNENGSRFSKPDYRNFFVKDSMEFVIDGATINMNSGSEITKISKTIELKGSDTVRVYSNNMKVK
jgi:hypothetical protein